MRAYHLDTLSLQRVDQRSTHLPQEQAMGINKDQIQGRTEEAKGKVKEVVGHVVGNKDLENKGNLQKNVGVIQALVGDVEEDAKKALKKP
jgi:uncharacterized protein YjbJ (UPF0337 family)